MTNSLITGCLLVCVSTVLNPDDVDAELERLEPTKTPMSQNGTASETGGEKAGETEAETVPRPLSPTRLQPVVAPETVEMSEIFRILSEVPRALRRRGSDQVAPVEKPPTQPASQYKQIIKRFLRRKGDQKMQLKGELESDSNSSSEDEEQSMTPLAPVSPPRDLAGQKVKEKQALVVVHFRFLKSGTVSNNINM